MIFGIIYMKKVKEMKVEKIDFTFLNSNFLNMSLFQILLIKKSNYLNIKENKKKDTYAKRKK